MVSTLSSLRTDLVTALQASGIKAVGYVAEQITPPVAVVIPAQPYITRPENEVPYGYCTVNLTVLLISGKGTGRASAEALDELIESVLAVLDDWDITEVAQPGQVNLNGSTYLGTVISIENTTKIGA